MTSREDRYLGCLLGLAAGDAVGTTVEFELRGSFEPLVGMVGGGPFRLQAGEWTDDTSMALCLGYSLVETPGFDADDQMKRYVDWMRNGSNSSNGVCFDIGMTVSSALRAYERSGQPFSGSTDPYSAGNGSIMRLAPVPMYFAPDVEQVIHFSAESSKTTHGTAECLDACRLFGAMLNTALEGGSKEAILFGSNLQLDSEKMAAIAAGEYAAKTRDQIRGSGYVVESLEAALWCFQQADSYRETILLAANLGDDADTTAAVCGQIAGAYYGRSGIPESWLEKLALEGAIEKLALDLMAG